HLADVLAEMADGRAAIDRDLSRVGLFLPDDHAKDRRLARAVRPDEPHLFAAKRGERCIHEQDLVAVLVGDAVEWNHAGTFTEILRFALLEATRASCRAALS